MRVTIIRDDGVVGIDGIFRKVDLAGLYEGVRAVQWDGQAGHVENHDGSNVALTEITVFQAFVDLWTAAAPPPPPPPTPTELKASALTRINSAYQAAVNAMTAGYPKEEIESWPKQEQEARAWLASPAGADTPWINAAAAARGIAKGDLVVKIMDNANTFTAAHGTLTGKRQMLRDQIEALGEAPTQAQLDAIQW